jgi:hypothetical protein
VTIAAFLVVALFVFFLSFQEPKRQRRPNNHNSKRLRASRYDLVSPGNRLR